MIEDEDMFGKFYEKRIQPLVIKAVNRQRNKMMHSPHGIACLDALYQACKEQGADIWLEFGSMLGAYRDHGFIPFDFDIDLGMYRSEFTPQLVRGLYDRGFRIRRVFKQVRNQDIHNKVVTELTLYRQGITIDIFLNDIDGDKRVMYAYNDTLGEERKRRNIFGVRRFVLPVAGMEEIDFVGIRFKIPSNAKQCLAYYYGESFMTPIKNWKRDTADLDLPYEQAYGEMVGAW